MGAMRDAVAVENEIMTAQEVAQYLRLDVATIYRLAQSGEIPAVKVGRAWRFKKALINDWFRREAAQNPPSEEPVPELAAP